MIKKKLYNRSAPCFGIGKLPPISGRQTFPLEIYDFFFLIIRAINSTLFTCIRLAYAYFCDATFYFFFVLRRYFTTDICSEHNDTDNNWIAIRFVKPIRTHVLLFKSDVRTEFFYISVLGCATDRNRISSVNLVRPQCRRRRALITRTALMLR